MNGFFEHKTSQIVGSEDSKHVGLEYSQECPLKLQFKSKNYDYKYWRMWQLNNFNLDKAPMSQGSFALVKTVTQMFWVFQTEQPDSNPQFQQLLPFNFENFKWEK